GLHAAGVDIAFVDHGGVQVARHIDCTGGNQIEAPWHRAQNRQRAGILQLSRVNFDDFRFGRVVKNFGQVRTRTALLIYWRVQLVNNHAGDAGVFRTAEAAARQFDTLFQLLWGIRALRHHENDLCVQGFREFKVQRLGKLVFTGRDQAFNQHHFRVLRVCVVVGNDLFHQHVFLVAGEQRFNVAHLQRFSRWQIGVLANDGGGLVWRIATGTWLGDRLKDAQTNAFAFHSADHAEADAGQADAGSGRDQHNSTGHGLSSFVTAALGGLQNSTASIAGGVESGSQAVRVLRDDQLFVSWDNDSRAGAFFVDEARLAEAGSQVTLMINFEAQNAQFAQGQFTYHCRVLTDTAGEDNSIQTAFHQRGVRTDVLRQTVAINVHCTFSVSFFCVVVFNVTAVAGDL